MATKAELEKEVESLTGKLKRAKAKAAKVVEPDTTLHDAASALCAAIEKRGLRTQVGQKAFHQVVDALG